MSIIYSDAELTQIEKLMGREFIELYEKIWGERNKVKNYLRTVKISLNASTGYTKTYWEYKRGEVVAVLQNQSKWLREVIMEPLKGKISDDMYSKLENYLNENEPQV
uniref:Uncharacterized protein n=1 Tax=viral metagenome TaxID=1070528 RepID=A0A6M3MGR3_9ZZZZ